LYASNDWKTFKYEGLRWKTEDFKIPTYQVCSYNVMNPPGGYTSGRVYLKVNEPEAGVKLYLEQNGEKTKITYGK